MNDPSGARKAEKAYERLSVKLSELKDTVSSTVGEQIESAQNFIENNIVFGPSDLHTNNPREEFKKFTTEDIEQGWRNLGEVVSLAAYYINPHMESQWNRFMKRVDEGITDFTSDVKDKVSSVFDPENFEVYGAPPPPSLLNRRRDEE